MIPTDIRKDLDITDDLLDKRIPPHGKEYMR